MDPLFYKAMKIFSPPIAAFAGTQAFSSGFLNAEPVKM